MGQLSDAACAVANWGRRTANTTIEATSKAASPALGLDLSANIAKAGAAPRNINLLPTRPKRPNPQSNQTQKRNFCL
jgi:hypothetical protein